jgi:hypothetical protein
MTRKYGFLVMICVLAAAMLCYTNHAQAQGPGGRGGMRGMMGGGPMGGGGAMMQAALLGNEKVQKELDLVDDQKKKIADLEGEMRISMRDMFSSLQDLSGEERMTKMQELMKENQDKMQKKLADILLPHQLDRLKQIQLQAEGPMALFNADVIKELNLSTEQQDKMKTARDESGEKMRDLMGDMRDLSREERQAKMAELRDKMQKMRDDLNAKLTEILTQDQRDKLEKMKGAKVDIDFANLRPMGPGGRNGRRGPPDGPPPDGPPPGPPPGEP